MLIENKGGHVSGIRLYKHIIDKANRVKIERYTSYDSRFTANIKAFCMFTMDAAVVSGISSKHARLVSQHRTPYILYFLDELFDFKIKLKESYRMFTDEFIEL